MEFNGAGELFIDGESIIDGKPIGRVEGITVSIQRLNDSLERLHSALATAACEWPDEIIEDILDADEIG